MRKTWDLIRPTVVLVLVCAVISGLLALTYNLAGVAALENAGYTEEELAEYGGIALPEADKLVQVEVETEDSALKYVYKAENGAGMALVLNVKGYDSTKMEIMYGFNAEGVMQGIKVISDNETPGIGKNVIENQEYLAQYPGLTADAVSGVDTITGATKTSGGIRTGAEQAFALFEQLKGEVLGQ